MYEAITKQGQKQCGGSASFFDNSEEA